MNPFSHIINGLPMTASQNMGVSTDAQKNPASFSVTGQGFGRYLEASGQDGRKAEDNPISAGATGFGPGEMNKPAMIIPGMNPTNGATNRIDSLMLEKLTEMAGDNFSRGFKSGSDKIQNPEMPEPKLLAGDRLSRPSAVNENLPLNAGRGRFLPPEMISIKPIPFDSGELNPDNATKSPWDRNPEKNVRDISGERLMSEIQNPGDKGLPENRRLSFYFNSRNKPHNLQNPELVATSFKAAPTDESKTAPAPDRNAMDRLAERLNITRVDLDGKGGYTEKPGGAPDKLDSARTVMRQTNVLPDSSIPDETDIDNNTRDRHDSRSGDGGRRFDKTADSGNYSRVDSFKAVIKNHGTEKNLPMENSGLSKGLPGKIEIAGTSWNINQTGNIEPGLTKTESMPVRFIIPENIPTIGPDKSRTITIRMEPDYLGKVRLTLSSLGDRIIARMVVEDTRALMLVESNMNQMLTDLSDKGLKLDAFQVSVGGQSGEKTSSGGSTARFINKGRKAGMIEKTENGPTLWSPESENNMYINAGGVNWLA